MILDFGLASDVVPDDAAVGESMAGTPAYLAPERRAGAAPSEGHDWYSVGVTLYEALTGRVPFEGPFEDVLRRKRETDPCPPAEIAPDVPDDLNAICMGLLRRDPVQRMTGQEAARILERDSAVSGEARPSQADAEPPFVGRHRQLDALETALREAKHGTATAVYVHGPSGIGKSALVQCFLDRVLNREDVVVLRGRCYEYESVPYKALDGVIDSLSQHLSALPRSQADPLLPPDLAALSRLFPVMLQVEAAASVRHARTRERRSLRLAAASIHGAARTADPHGGPATARRLHRRPSLGGRRQRGAARGAAAPPAGTSDPDDRLPSHRRDRVQAVPAGVARAHRLEGRHRPPARADD